MKIYVLALATLFSTNICATQHTRKARVTTDDKVWAAASVVVEDIARCSIIFLLVGYIAQSQIDAEQRLKWGVISGLLVGVFRAAGKYRETTAIDTNAIGSNPTSDQKQLQQQTEPTNAGS